MICPGCGVEHAALHDGSAVELIPHLGASGIGWMNQAGIHTVGQLSAMGAVAAYLQIESLGVKPGSNILYALEAAIKGAHWLEIKRLNGGELQRLLAIAREQVTT